MGKSSHNIAQLNETVLDYDEVLTALGYEVRPNKRMFRRLSMRPLGKENRSFVGVPDMRNARDAELYLRPSVTNGRFVEISQSSSDCDGYWSARFMSYDGKEIGNASSSSLGAAMWAAFAKSKGL